MPHGNVRRHYRGGRWQVARRNGGRFAVHPRLHSITHSVRCYNSGMRTIVSLILAWAACMPGAAWSTIYACQMTGEVSSTCCCKAERDDACASIDDSCECCELEFKAVPAGVSSVPAAVANSDSRTFAPASISGFELVDPASHSAPAAVIIRTVASAPPLLYLLNQSFRR